MGHNAVCNLNLEPPGTNVIVYLRPSFLLIDFVLTPMRIFVLGIVTGTRVKAHYYAKLKHPKRGCNLPQSTGYVVPPFSAN